MVNRGIPLAKLDDESSSSDSESEGDRTGLSFHNDLDLNIHEWSVAPVGVLTHIPRKVCIVWISRDVSNASTLDWGICARASLEKEITYCGTKHHGTNWK